jgi:16S rRNA (cytidine1402-2'-O)-methyltransferase
MVTFFQHSRPQVARRILDALREGKNVAYVTEAGTPSISDPGAELVRLCFDAGIRVSPIPGATAIAAAISVSGLVAGPFVFEGFLPARPAKRRRRLRALASERRPIVFYESPHRIAETLEDMAQILGDRPVVIARELTKIHEEILRLSLAEARTLFRDRPALGEFTLVVPGAPAHRPAES